jgi:hypothetical protein
MRSLRITVGLFAALLTVSLAVAPAYAKKAPKEKAFFGEFVAEVAGQEISPTHKVIARGKDSPGILTMTVGKAFTVTCEKDKSIGEVEHERSETFTTKIIFSQCTAHVLIDNGHIRENKPAKVGKDFAMEFRANGSAQSGTESEAKIVHGSTVTTKIKGSKCEFRLPNQTLPLKAEKNPEGEFETATYFTTQEEESNLSKYPKGFKEELEIDFEMENRVVYEIPVSEPTTEETGGCELVDSGNSHYNPETKAIEEKGGLEFEIEEIGIKGGSFGFSTEKPEEEAEV